MPPQPLLPPQMPLDARPQIAHRGAGVEIRAGRKVVRTKPPNFDARRHIEPENQLVEAGIAGDGHRGRAVIGQKSLFETWRRDPFRRSDVQPRRLRKLTP